jgi:Peptidase family C25/CARDB
MKRIIFLFCCIFFAHSVNAQYNNEWIDYSNTYYKFKVGANGLYRISATILQSAGLGSTPVEKFQLWRNGKEVPLFTSVASGVLSNSDFIEFYGEQNDGKPDKKLYKNPLNQQNDLWSLQTDTAAYFLTVAKIGVPLRITMQTNDVASNTLAPEAYFMHTFNLNTKQKLNPGFASVVGEYVYSSSYEAGEGWTTQDISPTTPIKFGNYLYINENGPNPQLSVAISGNAMNFRSYNVSINGNVLLESPLEYFNQDSKTVSVPMSVFLKNTTEQFQIATTSGASTDRTVVSKLSLTYPRVFNFGGLSQFLFELPAAVNGNYLEIEYFDNGGVPPVLFDLTNNKKYVANTSVAGKFKFALLPSSVSRKLVLLNALPSNTYNVSNLQPRVFKNFGSTANQGDYLIVSNPRLYTSSNGNPVEAYRLYRSSTIGGGFNAKVFDMDQLIDQFAFGIKGHPLAVKNFISYAKNTFAVKPKAVLLIGRGILYSDYRINEALPIVEELNLVPTFGSPGSDNQLASENFDPVADISIGRISTINGDEVDNYLQKVKQYENVYQTLPNTVKGRSWMKNVVHAIGGSDPYLQAVIYGYMMANANVLKDTLFGGNVYSFSKNSSLSIEQISSSQLQDLFAEGINILTYFGHSSTNTLEFNIDEPSKYNNQGKYPVFLVNGCSAGNIFVYDTLRKYAGYQTLSEKYVLAKERGSIAFFASTHYGIVNYLNIFTNSFYNQIGKESYGATLGDMHRNAMRKMLTITGNNDYYARIHAEEINIHGDPALKLYSPTVPDFVVEDQMVSINPTPVSVADKRFLVNIKLINLGKAIGDSTELLVQRQLPSGAMVDVFRGKREALKYIDSMEFSININPLTDKGNNKIFVTVDPQNAVVERDETNNSVTKSFVIVEDEIRPVYPYNYAIVKDKLNAFFASAANPFAPQRNYVFEIDTTELFNSPLKKAQTVFVAGGLIQFNVPDLNYLDSTVYYWRTAPVPTGSNPYIWNVSSFVYIPKSLTVGYSQSHYFQFKKNTLSKMQLKDNRLFDFDQKISNLKITTGLYPYYYNDKLKVTINENNYISYGCKYNSIQIVVYDSLSLKPWSNSLQPNGLGRFNSWNPCSHNNYAFEFPYFDAVYRKRAIDFIESIPKGHFISITNLGTDSNVDFVKEWMSDTLTLGSGKSLYHTLKKIGFSSIDNFTKNVPFLFFAKNQDFSYPVYQNIGTSTNDYLSLETNVTTKVSFGTMESAWFGPALKWNILQWKGTDLQPFHDITSVDIYGKKADGTDSLLAHVASMKDTSIAFIKASDFPFLKLKMYNLDSLSGTPNQLNYWMLNANLPPEGTIAPVVYFKSKDSLSVGEPLDFEVAFKNISQEKFDSVSIQLIVTDASNTPKYFNLPKLKPLAAGDTVKFSYRFDTKKMIGANTLFVNFNPDYAQPEQYLFNNFLFKQFYVKDDLFKPTLDVTFDGVHILNRDIVSSKPHITIKLTDDSKYLLLDDTSLLSVKVKYPSGKIRNYSFNNDTLRFIPAIKSTNSGNTATIEFMPYWPEDGEYELIVYGQDKSGNKSGIIEYKVAFTIINKSMISNLLNYPNPFTTSTAFVFTLTGNEIPQNLRIQIMTVTGKIVKDITKDELGPIHIGRNITEYKWDGKDQFGQPLANGIYLYRIVSNNKGKSMDKFTQEGDTSDKFFKGGYGKMYLMR